MDRNTFINEHTGICRQARELVDIKIKGYSGDNTSVFSNFSRVEDLGICSTSTGILARMADKMGRLTTYINSGGQLVGDEKFTDTLMDLLNYTIFLSVLNSGVRPVSDEVDE